MENLEKRIVAHMATSTRQLKLTFLGGLIMTIIGCGGIVYAILTPPLSTMPLYSKLGVGFMGVLMVFCEIGLWFCYKKSRKCSQDYRELNKKAIKKE